MPAKKMPLWPWAIVLTIFVILFGALGFSEVERLNSRVVEPQYPFSHNLTSPSYPIPPR
jgi:hypothetical protein